MTHLWMICDLPICTIQLFFQTFHLTFWHLIWQSVRDRGRRRSFRSNLRPRVEHEISTVSSWYLDITIIIVLSFLMVKSPLLIWLVVDLPLWKIWIRQLRWWHSQYMEKITFMFHYWLLYPIISPIKNTMLSHYIPSIIYVPNHQPVMLIFFLQKNPHVRCQKITMDVWVKSHRCTVILKSPVLIVQSPCLIVNSTSFSFSGKNEEIAPVRRSASSKSALPAWSHWPMEFFCFFLTCYNVRPQFDS